MNKLMDYATTRKDVSSTERYLTVRFLNQWGTPDCVSFDAFVSEYIRALEGTDPDILKAAGNHLIDHHRYPMRWPTVAECRAIIHEIADERARRKTLMIAPPDEVPPTPEQRARAAKLMEQAAARIKAGGDAMVVQTSTLSKTVTSDGPKYAESGVKLAPGWRDTSRNAFESRPGKLYQERPAPKLSELGRPVESNTHDQDF